MDKDAQVMAGDAGYSRAKIGFDFGVFVGDSPQPTVDAIVGDKQRVLLEALADYNETVEAALVLEPNTARVKLAVDVAREECVGCGRVL
jgi:hypothetical protein